MPAFCARWPDGSFSIVDAEDETDALIQLDELGDEPAELWLMQSCLVDFELTDDGTFRLKQFGEQTVPEILERGYPMLDKALEAQRSRNTQLRARQIRSHMIQQQLRSFAML
jgi:hypothetical protein